MSGVEVVGAATPEEAAAALAAVEAFRTDTAVAAPAPPATSPSAWLRAARREAVSREPDAAGAWGA